jgi:anti-sigma factor RsiW
MKHPDEATLALYAGQDLGALAQWRTRRHLAGCARCRAEVAEFSALRRHVTDLNELPDIAWNRLAAEMRANIRVGLAAGECIRDTRHPLTSAFSGMRAAVACASVAALLLAGLWLERPAPLVIVESHPGVSLRAVDHGIEVRDGDQAFVMKNGSAGEVTYSAGAQGSIGARFVDRSTGYLTINTVYVQ